jgi:carboxylesterase type B
VSQSSECHEGVLVDILRPYSYRLGAAGFMTSKELRDAGYKANNGFHDQRTAMQWVRKNIGGFGGDPEEITTVGESAGGCGLATTIESGRY